MGSRELALCITSFFIGIFLGLYYFSSKSVPSILSHDLTYAGILLASAVLLNLMAESKKWPGYVVVFPFAAAQMIFSIDDVYVLVRNEFPYFFVAALCFCMLGFVAHILTIGIMKLYHDVFKKI